MNSSSYGSSPHHPGLGLKLSRRRRPVSTVLALIAAVTMAACSPSDDEEAQGEPDAPRVTVGTAKDPGFGPRFSLFGSLTAERHASLSPRVDGLVSRIAVDAGDQVEEGQLLAELDPDIGHQVLSRARAGLQEAQARRREAERLLVIGRQLSEQTIARSQIEARESEVALARAVEASARASVREQEELIARHQLPAPFRGVISERLTEVGAWVQRGTPVFTLVATDRVRLDLRVPQERFSELGADARIQVLADALGGVPLKARVGAIVPVTDPRARTFLLRLIVDDPQRRLLPGTSARAEISSEPAEGAVEISRDALRRQPDGSYHVFVVEENDGRLLARRESVRILYERDGQIVVMGELRAGQRVVTRGNEGLENGQVVELVER
jgi:RND family efflux transporter MFP subunit